MKLRLSTVICFVIILMQLIFTSCSSLPSESEAKKSLKDKIEKESKGKIELIEFSKTNGLNQNIFGKEIYTVEFSALIELKEAGYKDLGPDGVNFNYFNMYEKEKGRWEFRMDKYLEKGFKAKLKGAIDYEKTENGWRPSEHMSIEVIN